MSSGTVCGQTPILDLAAGVREHLAAKGYKERDIIRLQKIWNHFARYADNCHFTIEIGAAFLRDAYGIEWAEFPPPMKRHQRRSVSAIRYLRDYELNGEISLHRPMKQPYVWPNQFLGAAQSFLRHMDENGYSRDYVRGTTREVHKFLGYLSDCGVQSCETITISNVMDFIRDQYSHFAVSTLKTTVGKLRTFLDWEKSTIQIPQVKTDELLSLPMPAELGWALIDYIRDGRPETDSPFIFVRHCAPFQAFCSNNNFHYQMRKYAALAGITPPSSKLYGLHSIRHTFATNLLKEGTSLSLISEFLGHNGVSATPVYLKVDDEHLRICALDPDIEVEHE